ncbi:hypothetical protein TRFO_42061 [Tritrichomonas foetus]|uniref:Initiator binding domain-containing protein n=1 Tax=Tritrichomonas foetus TaxID=1144522 RepID=A0A1J4KXW2_9EUKA|nr:hypothetical protein TRFO_42061 [Tritrichomonas foetus]|eukprot:OHT16083.1 hypothetical protein TRFO_42061 [Tritrichomonas foetus]
MIHNSEILFPLTYEESLTQNSAGKILFPSLLPISQFDDLIQNASILPKIATSKKFSSQSSRENMKKCSSQELSTGEKCCQNVNPKRSQIQGIYSSSINIGGLMEENSTPNNDENTLNYADRTKDNHSDKLFNKNNGFQKHISYPYNSFHQYEAGVIQPLHYFSQNDNKMNCQNHMVQCSASQPIDYNMIHQMQFLSQIVAPNMLTTNNSNKHVVPLPSLSQQVSGYNGKFFAQGWAAQFLGKISHTLNDPLNLIVNPIELSFLPKEIWLVQNVPLRIVLQTFFKARSTKNLRFEHKLWNALSLTKNYPELVSIVGIYWVSHDVIKVHRDLFGSLINVTKPSAALFNNQGSFITHGFIEISKQEALSFGVCSEWVEDVDEYCIRLFRHSSGLLKATSTRSDIYTCRWNK